MANLCSPGRLQLGYMSLVNVDAYHIDAAQWLYTSVPASPTSHITKCIAQCRSIRYKHQLCGKETQEEVGLP